MKIHHNIEDFVSTKTPLALSIGVFDGVHLGHKAVLQRLKEAAPYTVVFTFSNHPEDILHSAAIPHLTTLPHRLSLLEKLGIDEAVVVPFSLSFSKTSARSFLTQLKKHIPFSHLILGHDAALGNDRCRDLSPYAQELGFQLEYLPPIQHGGEIISSSVIRKKIQSGELLAASALLGRPYSIAATVQPGHGKGKELGFHTANLPVTELALPPTGVWAVYVQQGGEKLPAIANLGKAPTFHENRPICLEVHLLDDHRNLYGQTLEVIFQQFLRPEMRFPSPAALQAQIREDIQACKKSLAR